MRKILAAVAFLLCAAAAQAQVNFSVPGPGPLPGCALSGCTYTGTVIVSAASFGLIGNQSASGIFGTSGIRYKNVAGTLNDTTASGTIAANYDSVFGGNTLTSTNPVTITNNYGSYFNAPVCSTNVTCTNNSALGADSISIGGAMALTGTTYTAPSTGYGIYLSNSTSIRLYAGSGGQVFATANGTSFSTNGSAWFYATSSQGPSMLGGAPSGVLPSFVQRRDAPDAGIGASAAGNTTIIASNGTGGAGVNALDVAYNQITLLPATYASCTALTTNGSGVIGCTASDKRLKLPQGQINNATEVLAKIPAARLFTYRDVKRFDAKAHIGLYAQDVCNAAPLACAKRPYQGHDEYNYDDRAVIALLVKSNQELTARIAKLEHLK